MDFIKTYAAKGAQAARVFTGDRKRMGGGSWKCVLDICVGLKVMGIPRATKLLRATLGCGPGASTVKGKVRELRDKTTSTLGLMDSVARIKTAARLWSPLLEEKMGQGLLLKTHIIPCTAGADATPVPALPQYCARRNCIVGLCGVIAPEHKCTLDPPEQILCGEDGFRQIVRLVVGNVWASYMYVHIIQPQVDWLPPFHAHLYATCNCYDHKPHLEFIWTQISEIFARYMPANLMLTGKGSDGDPRERTLMLQLMYSRWRQRHHPRGSIFSRPLPQASQWISLDGAKGFRMKIELTAGGLIRGLMAQDPIHVVKKIDCKLDSAKVLELGFYTCVHGHLQHVFALDSDPESCVRRAQRQGNKAGLWRGDVYRQDRQNFMACVRRAGYKNRRALISLQPRGALNMSGPTPRLINRGYLPARNDDPATMTVLDAVFLGADDRAWGSPAVTATRDIRTQGTVAFYVLNAAYMLIHHSQYFGILQRARFAGFCNMFVAHWRCWVLRTNGLTLGNNFLTKECYSDLVLSCHEAVLQMIVFKRYAPSLPLRLNLSGSNVCENSFSAAGGYRGMHGKRNYTCLGYADWAENEHLMNVMAAVGVRRGRAQHAKQEWDSRLHEPTITRAELDIKLRRHPDNDELRKSWNAGACDASHFAEKLGLRNGVLDNAWTDPWTATGEKLHVEEVGNAIPCIAPISDSESSSDDDDDDDVHAPPSDVVLTVEDVMVPTFAVLSKKLIKQTIVAKVQMYLQSFLYGREVDDTVVSKILCEAVVTKETQSQRKERYKKEHDELYVTVPGTGKKLHKERLVQMVVQDVLLHGRADGTILSKDRVARIKATAARVRAQQEDRLTAAVEGERANLQDDLAFCFVHRDGRKKLWFGRLQQMRSKIGGRTRNLHQSVDLTNPPQELKMQCQWYHETKKKSGKYVPSSRTVNVDKSFVDVQTCLGLVEFECTNGVYTLAANGQMKRFRRLMNTIN